MFAPPVRYARSDDGLAIAYAEYGEGPPLLVSTGPMVPLDLGWDEGGVWARLAESFRVVRFDPRGCGLSDRDNIHGSFHDEARDLLAVANAIGAPQLPLLGTYIGTPAAVLSVLNEPERFSHLILHSPLPSGPRSASDEDREQHGLLDEVVEHLLRVGWRHNHEGARRALLTLIAPDIDTQTARNLSQRMYAYAGVERVLQLMPDMRSLDFMQELHRIKTPTLISVTPEEGVHGVGRAWARAMPETQLTVQRSGASLLLSNVPSIDELAEAVHRFVLGEQRAAPPAVEATRTVLFTDIEGSTDLADQLGDEAARHILRRVELLTRAALEAHGGVEVKTMGDGFMAWFPLASSALDAAIQIERSVEREFAQTDRSIRVRIGVNAGEPIEEADDLFGATVNRAARIMGHAASSEVLVSDLVRGLVQGRGYRFKDRGEQQLRGIEEPQRLFALDWRATPWPADQRAAQSASQGANQSTDSWEGRES